LTADVLLNATRRAVAEREGPGRRAEDLAHIESGRALAVSSDEGLRQVAADMHELAFPPR
jgi:hypothetical protein